MKRTGVLAAVLLAMAGGSASAAQITLNGQSYNVDFITGSGSNAAIVSVDFGPDQYNFGIEWNGTAPMASDAIAQIAAASGGTLTEYSQFGGTFITGFKYKSYDLQSDTFGTLTPSDTSDDYPNLWFAFYGSSDGMNWAFPDNGNSGANQVPAVNGQFLAFARESTDFPGSTLPQVVATPEPASLALLAIAGMGLLARRRRS